MRLVEKLRQSWIGLRILRRMRRGRAAAQRHLRSPQQHPLPMPTFVQLRLTNLCNLRCRMCGQWGDTGIFRGPVGSQGAPQAGGGPRLREVLALERQLSLDEYVRLIDELAPHAPVISLFGGEPLLYPDLVPLVRHVKKRGLTLTMITNGSLLSRCADEIVEAGIDSIAVSFDGHPRLHDAIRGQDGSFERAAQGVRDVARARARLGRAHPVLLGIFPITELNLEAVDETMAALDALPLDGVNVGLRWFVPTEAGQAYETVMREEFGVAAPSWKGFEFSWPADEDAGSPRLQRLVGQLRGLRRRRLLAAVQHRPWVTFTPDLAPRHVPSYLTRHAPRFGHDLCPVAWYFAQVQPDGDVAFCGDFPDYVIGNVRRESFRALWTGPRAEAFRERLRREPLPICSRCCGSFVYGRWSREAVAPGGGATVPSRGTP
jgi:radical SAM protein with 4Fe4S-binding SPASM domain